MTAGHRTIPNEMAQPSNTVSQSIETAKLSNSQSLSDEMAQPSNTILESSETAKLSNSIS
jgi:hypothetical protein